MMNCKEYRDDVMTITAIPVSKISSDAATSAVLALRPTVSYDFSQHFDADTIVIGMTKAKRVINEVTYVYGSLIPIKRESGKAKDSEGDSVAGRLHTVTVNCEVDDRDSDVWNDLLTLERTPTHLLLTFRDNTQTFVAATEDTYVCEVERDGSKTSVSFKIQNLMGLQLVV